MKKVILIILSTLLLLTFSVQDKITLASEVSNNKCESTTQDNKKVEDTKEKQDVDTKKNSEVSKESTPVNEVKSESKEKEDKDAKDKSKGKIESEVNKENQDKDINKNVQDINKSTKKEEWIFDIKSPKENSINYDNVDIKIGELNVDYQVKKVTATIDCNSTDLTYVSSKGWEGKISTIGLKKGSNILKLYAVDIKGNEFTKDININIGSKPHIEITAPLQNQLVCSNLKLNIKASDLYGENCKIKVYIMDKTSHYPKEKVLASGTNEIIESVDLIEYAGRNLNIEIETINDDGISTKEAISVFVDELKGAEVIDNVNGTILDYKNNQILYKTNEEKLIMKDEITGDEKLIFQKDKRYISEAHITSTGVVLLIKDEYWWYEVYEYKEDTLKDLGSADTLSFEFNNNYAVWKRTGDLCFKDFSKDNLTVIYVAELKYDPSLWEAYVSENGDVSFIVGAIKDYSKYERKTYSYLYKYINGQLIKSSNDSEFRIFNTKSNENINVYMKETEKPNEEQLILNTNSYETVLAVGDYRYLPYMFSGDYFAYKKYVNGKGEIFLVKDGITTQVTFKSRSNLISLNQRGDIIVKTQLKSNGKFEDMYCLIKNGTNIKIPLYKLDDLNVFWIGDNLYAIRGGSIVKIDYSPEKNNEKPNLDVHDIYIPALRKLNLLSNASATDREDGDISDKIKIIENEVDNTKVGSYRVTYEVTDSLGETVTKTILVNVTENSKPYIIAYDKYTAFNTKIDLFSDVYAYDEEDGNLTSKIKIVENNVNYMKGGRYKVIYEVEDKEGQIGRNDIYVWVRGNTPPVIEAEDRVISFKSKFNPLDGVRSYDVDESALDFDMPPAVQVVENNVDTSKPGKYKVVFQTKDCDEHITNKEITVTVRENEKPSIYANDRNIHVNDTIDLLENVSASDSEDGDLNKKVKIIKNNVDTTKPGIYEVVYEVQDEEGQVVNKTIKVTVISNDKPVIIAEDITIKVGDKFNIMDGIEATDTEDGDITNKISTIGKVDTKTAGSYIVKYSVVDSDKNKVDVYRTVTVE